MDVMVRRALLLLLAAAAAAEDADEYFEIGVAYLRRGFFGPARRAFGESLAQAPLQTVPLAFMGIAAAAEGRAEREAAFLLREAYRNLPDGKTLRLDLAALLPSRRALRLLEDQYRRRLERATGADLRDALSVAAFLEVHGGAEKTPALDRLEREFKGDAYASRLRAGASLCSPPTSPPTSSGPSGAGAGSRSSRTRS
jgi:tetratricopeptide (TPR) repeat protein